MLVIRRLYDLQQLDLETDSAERSLEDTRRRLTDESALVAARRRIEELEGRLAVLEEVRRSQERKVEETRQGLERIEIRLYGGVITSPRELEAADLERSHFRDQQTAQEDNLLVTMVEIEETQSDLETRSAELARVESARETERPALEAEESLLAERLEELRRDRTDALPQFDAHLLAVYERLRGDRNGYAVARVERGMCQGCRIALPSAEVQRVRSSQDLIQCSSCQRILFTA